ncbi:MAG: YchJ family metal-binding protein [Pseudohongiellaceae bacterium]
MKSGDPCICCSGKTFSECCEPFLSYWAEPKTPKQLVRSRYAAYALGKHTEYLIKTWHPHTARSISIADLDMPETRWKGLEIMETRQKGDIGIVEFKAVFSTQDGPDETHHERSVFHRLNGKWLYLEGEASVQ